MNQNRHSPTDPLPSLADLLEEDEEAQDKLHRHLKRRERKLWKAKNRMPMHGKHLLRDNRKRQRKRRSEHIREW